MGNVARTRIGDKDEAAPSAWGEMSYEERVLSVAGEGPGETHRLAQDMAWLALRALDEDGQDCIAPARAVSVLFAASALESAAFDRMRELAEEWKRKAEGK